jgi:hypothetical protein
MSDVPLLEKDWYALTLVSDDFSVSVYDVSKTFTANRFRVLKYDDVVALIKEYKSVLEEEKWCNDCMTIAYGDGNCHCKNNNWDLVLIKKFDELFGEVERIK